MTIIATFEVSGHRIVIGDAMITSPIKDRVGVEDIPTFKGVPPLLTNEDVSAVVGLTFKILIPHERLLVAWCGLRFTAQMFCNSIYKFSSSKRNPTLQIEEWLGKYDKGLLHGTSIIVLWIRNDGRIEQWYHDAVPYELDAFDNVCIAGSGQEAMFDRIASLASTIDPAIPLSRDQAAALGLAICGENYAVQSLFGNGIAEGWGGAFEVAISESMRFRKIGFAKFSSWLWKNESGQIYIADQIPDYYLRYDKNEGLLTVSDGTSYLLRPFVPEMCASRILKFPLKKIKWHVATWLEKGIDDEVHPSTAVRRIIKDKEFWKIGDDSVDITSDVKDLAVKHGFIFIAS